MILEVISNYGVIPVMLGQNYDYILRDSGKCCLGIFYDLKQGLFSISSYLGISLIHLM